MRDLSWYVKVERSKVKDISTETDRTQYAHHDSFDHEVVTAADVHDSGHVVKTDLQFVHLICDEDQNDGQYVAYHTELDWCTEWPKT